MWWRVDLKSFLGFEMWSFRYAANFASNAFQKAISTNSSAIKKMIWKKKCIAPLPNSPLPPRHHQAVPHLQTTHCNTLQHTVTYCHTLEHAFSQWWPLCSAHVCTCKQHTATHTATHTVTYASNSPPCRGPGSEPTSRLLVPHKQPLSGCKITKCPK